MADWKKLLYDVLLDDGQIDEQETRLLKKEILADGIVDDEEMDFLVELRNDAEIKNATFEAFFLDALKQNMLADNAISVKKVDRLHKIIMADGIVDGKEKKFLREIKKQAKRCVKKFDKVFSEYLQ